MSDGATLSATIEPGGPAEPRRRPHLFLVLQSHNLGAPPARIALDGVDEVLVGRGARAFTRKGTRVEIRLDDPWLSSQHAAFVRVLRRWALEDRGAKNGCFLDGARTERAELAGGEVVELGHSFFLFAEVAVAARGAPILEASALAPAHPAFTTLLPDLGDQLDRLTPVARSEVPVILEGETGTGKEVFARAVHALSRRSGAFIAVNCGALPRDLVEAELFGHKKGAFSGATEDRLGLVRAADRGTLLLDEIGDLPLPSQAALLRVLQEREVRPVGAARPVSVDLRVVAATHRPLDRMADEGAFRADLLARLSGYRLTLPPLRERRADLGLLTSAILAKAVRGGAAEVTVRSRAARALLAHVWPGNVRELEKALGTAVVLAEGAPIDAEHLPPPVRQALDRGAAARLAESQAEARDLVAALREHEGNIAAVARAMGKARMQIQRMMKKHGVDPDEFRRR